MEKNQMEEILAQLGCSAPIRSVTRFLHKEDREFYNVWKLETAAQTLVLKKAKGYEKRTYPAFFSDACGYAPRFYGNVHVQDWDYILTEFIPGQDLCRCDRKNLEKALSSLVAMQDVWWEKPEPQGCYTYAKSLEARLRRGAYLQDSRLEAAYSAFLQEYSSLPRSLCHDDLLPFNVICNERGAVFIDWEYGGILPYPVSLARLIAHCEETEAAFFFMTEEDKKFALDYYYEHLIRRKGICREAFDRSMVLFLFYECCEWVFLGNRYGNRDTDRFRSYWKKAQMLAAQLGF